MSMAPVGMRPSNHALASNPRPGNDAEWSGFPKGESVTEFPDRQRGLFERKGETPSCARAPSG